MVLLAVSVMSAVSTTSSDSHIEEKYHSLSRTATDKVAIMTVEGTILTGEGFAKKQIDKIRDDKNVKAIVLRIDSPGGTVTGSDYIFHHLTKLVAERKIPLVVSMGGIAASGGYYIAMAVGDEPNSIYAEPTTWTGSIGVVIPHYDLSGLMKEIKVSEDSVKSHRLKQMGSPFKEMTEEERAKFQGLVDDSFARFKEIVKKGRPYFRDRDAELTKVATGEIFTTNQALASKLVDKEGFIEDAIDRAIELAKLDKKETKVVQYKQPFGLLEGLFMKANAQPAGLDLKALLDLATPRAYYLCTFGASADGN
jgi:protease-4